MISPYLGNGVAGIDQWGHFRKYCALPEESCSIQSSSVSSISTSNRRCGGKVAMLRSLKLASARFSQVFVNSVRKPRPWESKPKDVNPMAGADSCPSRERHRSGHLWWNFMEIPLRHFLFRMGHNYRLEPKSDGQWFKLNMAKPSFQLDLQCLGAKQICFSIIQWSIDSHGRRNLKRKSQRNVHGHLWQNWMPPGWDLKGMEVGKARKTGCDGVFSVPLVLVINFVWCNLVKGKSYGVLVLSWNVSGGEPRLLVLIHLIYCGFDALNTTWVSAARNLLGACSALVGDFFPAHFELQKLHFLLSFWVLDANRMRSYCEWTAPHGGPHPKRQHGKWSQSGLKVPNFKLYLVIPWNYFCLIDLIFAYFCQQISRTRLKCPSAPLPSFTRLLLWWTRRCWIRHMGRFTSWRVVPVMGRQYRGGCTEILPLVADQSELHLDC